MELLSIYSSTALPPPRLPTIKAAPMANPPFSKQTDIYISQLIGTIINYTTFFFGPSTQADRLQLAKVSYIYIKIRMQGGDTQYLTIVTNKIPMRSSNVYQMLVFEWVLFGYYLFMFTSVLQTGEYQGRVLIYCLVFLLFDKLELSYKYLELQDPLHLSPTINGIRFLSYLCIFNLCALLVRIVTFNQNLHAFIIIMHFLLIMALFINEFSKKSTKLDINVDSNNVFSKYVTPLSLFIFNKTCKNTLTQVWYLELAIFALNLFLSSELNRILLFKECQYLGRLKFEESGKEKASWNKRRALRTIIVICCVLIVLQNLLLIFQKIKFEVSITIVHSFIIAVLSYLLYIGYLPSRK